MKVGKWTTAKKGGKKTVHMWKGTEKCFLHKYMQLIKHLVLFL